MGRVFGVYRSEAAVFTPARSLRLRASHSAQDDEANEIPQVVIMLFRFVKARNAPTEAENDISN